MSNQARITFLHQDALAHLENIKTDTSEYYLSLLSNDLLLICKPFDNTIFTYPIENTMILARVANLDINVEYDNGYIYWDEYMYDDGPIPDPIIFSHDLGFKVGESECPVCYEDFGSGMISTCGHGVCTSCLNEMSKNNMNTCPICRSESFKWLIGHVRGYVMIP